MVVRAPRVDVARMLRCRCSVRRRCSQPEHNATRPAPSVHALVAVLPSRFLAFSLVALKVLGLKNKNSRAEGVNQPSSARRHLLPPPLMAKPGY